MSFPVCWNGPVPAHGRLCPRTIGPLPLLVVCAGIELAGRREGVRANIGGIQPCSVHTAVVGSPSVGSGPPVLSCPGLYLSFIDPEPEGRKDGRIERWKEDGQCWRMNLRCLARRCGAGGRTCQYQCNVLVLARRPSCPSVRPFVPGSTSAYPHWRSCRPRRHRRVLVHGRQRRSSSRALAAIGTSSHTAPRNRPHRQSYQYNQP